MSGDMILAHMAAQTNLPKHGDGWPGDTAWPADHGKDALVNRTPTGRGHINRIAPVQNHIAPVQNEPTAVFRRRAGKSVLKSGLRPNAA